MVTLGTSILNNRPSILIPYSSSYEDKTSELRTPHLSVTNWSLFSRACYLSTWMPNANILPLLLPPRAFPTTSKYRGCQLLRGHREGHALHWKATMLRSSRFSCGAGNSQTRLVSMLDLVPSVKVSLARISGSWSGRELYPEVVRKPGQYSMARWMAMPQLSLEVGDGDQLDVCGV